MADISREPRIVLQDKHILIVDKPSGMPAQPDPSGDLDVHTWAVQRFQRCGLHHRLDRPASGLMLLSLDPSVDRSLTRLFRDHDIGRSYHAVLVGDPPDGARDWNRPVGGKPARSRMEPLASAGGLFCAALTLETGRYHQLRQHAALDGTPIAGDKRYGDDAGRLWPRLALHAGALRLNHPATGALIEVFAPIPEDLRELWRRAGGGVAPGPG